MHNEVKPIRPSKFSVIKTWIGKHQLIAALSLGVIVVTGIFSVAILLMPKDTAVVSIQKSTKKKSPPKKFFSNLTGVEMPDEQSLQNPVTAVMIENSPDARPQSGLKKAGVVYEAVAEGGITRFIALYQHDKPELIGPVRSLRMYYLDWATPYQASIAHVGGSYNALQEVRSESNRDLDQFFNPEAYWRSSDRYAPHNMYTNFDKLDQLNSSKGYTSSVFRSFTRADGKPVAEPTASTISVNFSSALFNTSYTYDPSSNSYLRHLAGEPHMDREEGQLSPSVVVVLRVTAQARGGSDPYEDLVTSGTGQAFVFQNGTATELTWKKDERTAPLELIDSEGKAASLNRGQTWVSAITDRGSVSWQ